MSHTSGPWEVVTLDGDKLLEVWSKDGDCIAEMSKIAQDECGLEDANLIAAAPDNNLLLKAICLGVARWEFFTHSSRRGEICCGGIRYSADLNEFGVPVLHSAVRLALLAAIAKAEGK